MGNYNHYTEVTRKAQQMQKFRVKENPSKFAKFGSLPRLRGVRVRISYLGFFRDEGSNL